jgi:hypothetical protein
MINPVLRIEFFHMQNLLVIELKLMEKFQTLYSLKGVKGNDKGQIKPNIQSSKPNPENCSASKNTVKKWN